MNSFNHYAYGAVGDWLYQVVAGLELDPEAPGYKRVLIQPQPGGGLTYAKAGLDAMVGRIESMWTKENGAFQLSVTIPANCEGLVRIPAQSMEHITESGHGLEFVEGVSEIRQEKENVVIAIGSGKYCFEFNLEEKEKIDSPAG